MTTQPSPIESETPRSKDLNPIVRTLLAVMHFGEGDGMGMDIDEAEQAIEQLIKQREDKVRRDAEIACFRSLKYHMLKHYTSWGGSQGNCVPEEDIDDAIARLQQNTPGERI